MSLQSGRLKAAVLDVWENEPAIDTELLGMVDLATPHIAGYSFDGKVAGLIMIYEALCRYLGQAPQHSKEDFLPEPDVPCIDVPYPEGDTQEAVHQIVQRIYGIQQDDANMREMLTVPQENRGALFDELRKNYPRRREFQNTRICLADPQQALGRTLTGLGFHVDDNGTQA